MPFVKTPYLMVASQADAFQLGEDVGHMPKTKQELAYAQTFATATHAHGAALVAPYAHKQSTSCWRSVGLS